MKKLLAILMALMLVLINVAVFAEDVEETDIPTLDISSVTNRGSFTTTGENPPTPSFTKKYYDGESLAEVFPSETLTFTVTKVTTGAPDIYVDNSNTNTANQFVVEGLENTIDLIIQDVSNYGVGKYEYTIKEQAGNTQGVTYDAAQTGSTEDDPGPIVHVDVWVTYKTDSNNVAEKDSSGNLIKEQKVAVWVTKSAVAEKDDEIKNTYKVHDLEVKKTVTGNLADTTKAFPITVVLTAENNKTVRSDISLTVNDGELAEVVTGNGSAAETVTTPAATEGGEATTEVLVKKDWTGSKTIKLKIKHTGSVVFNNIPDGVSYTIVEDSAITHLANDEAATHLANANDTEAYYVTGEIKTATKLEADTKGDDAVVINNNKEITPNTGITLETLPYVLIAMIAMAGAAMLMIRKREEY